MTVLSHADQLEACRAVVRARQLAAAQGLSPEERSRRTRAHRAAVSAVVEHNQGLVFSVARRAARRCKLLDVEDLGQHGNLGLLKAIDKFDPERGVSFGTYASWWVGSFVNRAIMNEDPAVRVPVHVRDARKRLDRQASGFEAREGRAPDVAELAREAGLHPRSVAAALAVELAPAYSLDAPLAPEADVAWLDKLPGSEPSPEDEAERGEREAFALALVAMLPERERSIVVGRFWGGKTLADVGADAFTRPVSRERARQVETLALEAMRTRCRRERSEHA